MSAKTEEAKERMILKTRKLTPSLERKTRSARGSSKGVVASVGERSSGDRDMAHLSNQSNGLAYMQMKEDEDKD